MARLVDEDRPTWLPPVRCAACRSLDGLRFDPIADMFVCTDATRCAARLHRAEQRLRSPLPRKALR